MRKIPKQYDCPIDNVVIDICELVSGAFHRVGFTPNGITTLSMITGLAGVFALWKSQPIIAVVLIAISYFFDCLDGYYARKYKMTSKIGDLYDHIKDISVFSLYILVLFYRNKHKLSTSQWILVFAIGLLFIMLSFLYFACQEQIYDKEEDIPSLSWTRLLVPNKHVAKKLLRILRHCGLGTFTLIYLGFTLWIEFKK